jgi:two-component sensor histidine kinase
MTSRKKRIDGISRKKIFDKSEHLHFKNVRCNRCGLKKKLDRKTVLLQEINHRVKNNLQILSSILSLQLSEISDATSASKINDCITRIKTMAILHDRLHSSDNYEMIEFNDFIGSIITDLYNTFDIDYDRIKYRIETDRILLDADLAIPCGLIINELMTNSFKYAFPDGKDGEILISFMKDEDYKLRIKDNGIGYDENRDILTSGTFGIDIIKSLVHQLDGDIIIRTNRGFETFITFPCGPS